VESSCAGPTHAGRARYYTACAGSPRRRRYPSCVRALCYAIQRDLPSWLWNRQLNSNRPPLPDVPAVYFVSPTVENVRRIASDLAGSLYESFHLNFVEPLPRAVLEEFAAAVAREGTEELVSSVLDQYLSFISPSPALFSLLPPLPAPAPTTAPQSTAAASTTTRTSYTILNSPGSSEQDIEDEIERISAGLFSVVATSGYYKHEQFGNYITNLDYRTCAIYPGAQGQCS
jgi:hypothetical protein